MPTNPAIDPKTLTSFGAVAAGHEGVLSDPSGQMVIKPCTSAEVRFYETITSSHPALAAFLPRFYGTLSLAEQRATTASASASAGDAGSTGPRAADLRPTDPGPLHGAHLATDLHIVLGNATGGFARPNVLDLKLGARLWDDAAAAAKRERLDRVAAETTSGSLGVRIAGMRVWRGGEGRAGEEGLSSVEGETRVFNKMYGRRFGAGDVGEGIGTFLICEEAGVGKDQAVAVAGFFAKELKRLEAVLGEMESRMYSASVLLVYEGDGEAWREKRKNGVGQGKRSDVEESDGEEEEKVPEEVHVVNMIDFAHATLTPGEGPDENVLQGIRSSIKLFEDFVAGHVA